MTEDVVCLRVEFRGRVQGVGFRMTTARIARRFPLGGTVRNCTNGSVEIVVSGTREAVDDFLETLREAMRGNIEDELAAPGPVGISTDRFKIVH